MWQLFVEICLAIVVFSGITVAIMEFVFWLKAEYRAWRSK